MDRDGRRDNGNLYIASDMIEITILQAAIAGGRPVGAAGLPNKLAPLVVTKRFGVAGSNSR